MADAYMVEAVGGGAREQYAGFDRAEQDLIDRIRRKQSPQYAIRRIGAEAFGPERSLPETKDRWREILKGSNPGTGVIVKGSKANDPRFKLVHIWTEPDKGVLVLQAANSQLGVEYKWAWSDPRGDNDGSSGFDCSGLTSWCYAQVGVQLPHSAYWTYHGADNVQKFSERKKLEKGDLIFYNASSRPTPDHIGIYAGDGKVIDASTYYDAVVRRDMDSNPVTGFGRVPAVNGAL